MGFSSTGTTECVEQTWVDAFQRMLECCIDKYTDQHTTMNTLQDIRPHDHLCHMITVISRGNKKTSVPGIIPREGVDGKHLDA